MTFIIYRYWGIDHDCFIKHLLIYSDSEVVFENQAWVKKSVVECKVLGKLHWSRFLEWSSELKKGVWVGHIFRASWGIYIAQTIGYIWTVCAIWGVSNINGLARILRVQHNIWVLETILSRIGDFALLLSISILSGFAWVERLNTFLYNPLYRRNTLIYLCFLFFQNLPDWLLLVGQQWILFLIIKRFISFSH